MYLLLATLYFLFCLFLPQHLLATKYNKSMLQEKKDEVCRMILRIQTHKIISNTSFPVQKVAVAVAKMPLRGFTNSVRTCLK